MLTPMDRHDLQRFLKDPGVTLRWSRGATDAYEAVEIRDQRLRWYRWSHDRGEAEEETWQTREEFLANGPARNAPPRVLATIEARMTKP